MIRGGYGDRAEIIELDGQWGITIFFANGFVTYLIPEGEVIVADGIDVTKPKKNKNKNK